MHCKDWEERVALHADGDLAAAHPAEATAVEKHLAECAGCQVFWSGVKQSLELLRGAHAEALAPAAYTAMRARVMAGLEAELKAGPSAWWRWRSSWIPVGLAAAVLLMILMLAWPMRRVETPPQPVAALTAPAPAAQVSRAEPVKRLAHLPPVTKRRVLKSSAGNIPRQPLMVRLVTDDPNVVIYWIAD